MGTAEQTTLGHKPSRNQLAAYLNITNLAEWHEVDRTTAAARAAECLDVITLCEHDWTTPNGASGTDVSWLYQQGSFHRDGGTHSWSYYHPGALAADAFGTRTCRQHRYFVFEPEG